MYINWMTVHSAGIQDIESFIEDYTHLMREGA